MNYSFELLQVAIGNRTELSRIPTAEEWESMSETALKHSLVGITFVGVESLAREQWPSKKLLREWLGQSQVIEQRNTLSTEICLQTCKQFEEAGFRVCVLKGQANHAYYPEGLGKRRSCGDIDLWVVSKGHMRQRENKKRIIEFVKSNYGLKGLCHLHANMSPLRGIPVEVHFHPSFMNNPFHNNRFQKLFFDIDHCSCSKEIDDVTLPAMRIEFDMIYQMNHIYRHLIDEGVGLRQVLDYYFLCNSYMSLHADDKDRAIQKVMLEVERLGMKRFAGALMYVLKEVFGMSDDRLLCPSVEKDGRFLLNEIIVAGNFGQSDPRMKSLKLDKNRLSVQVNRALRRIKRNFRFLTTYPGEVIWEPFARLWHYVWKRFFLCTILG